MLSSAASHVSSQSGFPQVEVELVLLPNQTQARTHVSSGVVADSVRRANILCHAAANALALGAITTSGLIVAGVIGAGPLAKEPISCNNKIYCLWSNLGLAFGSLMITAAAVTTLVASCISLRRNLSRGSMTGQSLRNIQNESQVSSVQPIVVINPSTSNAQVNIQVGVLQPSLALEMGQENT